MQGSELQEYNKTFSSWSVWPRESCVLPVVVERQPVDSMGK
jgi:hypothetical protein